MRTVNSPITRSGRGTAARLLIFMIALTMTVIGLAAGGAGAQESDEDDPPIIGEETEDLAATGVLTTALVPTGVVLVLIGVHLTMFGQPAALRGLHSAPSSKLRSSYVALVASSIAGSVASVRRQRR